ncbi:MAG: hypothetical protein FWG89_07230 [Treponema sp.]|nr:hypothetical protein [Treponema sp.]
MNCLFDNNMPIKLAKTLSFLEGDEGITVKHLREKYPANTPDVEWITSLSKEDGWFIITQDIQIRNKPHEKKAWKESNIPIVFLPKSWTKAELWEKAWRLIKYWPKLKDSIIHNRKTQSFELTINGKITAIE